MSWCRLIVLAGILFALSACGVRGNLDPPPANDQKTTSSLLDKII
jgi:predicted small lipoprotein YifL